jgi:hypothetical protein
LEEKLFAMMIFRFVLFFHILVISMLCSLNYLIAEAISKPQLIGVDMIGYYTALPQSREFKAPLPENYFDDSFKLISQAGMNHIRFVYFWESYVKDPIAFMNEIKFVASAADKYGLKIIYDNHQFHTSSWLNPQRGTGFPSFLFQNNTQYAYGSGGSPKYPSAIAWWNHWWNREITDSNGTDGWTLQAEFLKQIVKVVDSHQSTVGYEILSEPQVHAANQWEKIGKFNSFITSQLRDLTSKNIVFSMTIPVDLKSPIGVNATNLALMTPSEKTNVIFKFSLYGLPKPGSYQEQRLNIFVDTGQIAGVPIYVGEWNIVDREPTVNEEGDVVYEISPETSNITPADTSLILDKFSEVNVYGWAFWHWNFRSHKVDNFNLAITGPDGSLQPTQYYDILKNAIATSYGSEKTQ